MISYQKHHNISYIFLYWYRISTMTEKAGDTDNYLEIHARVR